MSHSVPATLKFAVDTGEKPATYPKLPMDDPNRDTGKFEDRVLLIVNGREVENELSLDKEGFLLTDHVSSISDFYDENIIETTYYGECIALVKEFTGADRVEIFDHTYRIQDPVKREKLSTGAPVLTVHNDYTDWSGPKRVRDILPEEADDLLQNRYVMVNVWRPLIEPVLTDPLVLCDASTMADKDLIASDHIYPDRRGETYRVAYADSQKWMYFPEMTKSEAVLIKCYDNKTDGRARLSAHGAAKLIEEPAEFTPRESIEVRTIAFFDQQ
ncbi:MAG: methyltransferase [Rhodospirillaceae bacterium]|jgi:hypothetical protein|nr:methyltransferase [Rhodospirillaceae bacterium]MBT5938367.1 methyltransferase [Rhodospirillaceae bacterium]MBT7955140.1 methyltransferase [Rhodospirillaceae bacterium]